jgi:predicted RNA-binding protein with PUA-like domain
MAKGDMVFYYHSVEGREIVGLATVSKTAFPDPTAEEGDWSCVELRAGAAFKTPVSLDALKEHPVLKDLPLIRQSRLSVMPIPERDAKLLLKFGGV